MMSAAKCQADFVENAHIRLDVVKALQANPSWTNT